MTMTNEDRANAAEAATVAFRAAISGDDCDSIGDLICDLLHLARRKHRDRDPEAIALNAIAMWKTEEREDA